MSKVIIIINCFNGSQYLQEAINSIYAQTFKDWCIFFFDNCSSDSSGEIAKSFNHQLKYYRHDHTIPLGHARKLAVEMTANQSEWIAFLDTDDIWLPNKLERQMFEINKVDGSHYGLCYAI
jgi:glycosyltransferase involved in cell wall biosynthesis